MQYSRSLLSAFVSSIRFRKQVSPWSGFVVRSSNQRACLSLPVTTKTCLDMNNPYSRNPYSSGNKKKPAASVVAFSTEIKDDNGDEFGDASFLEGFDVEAAVREFTSNSPNQEKASAAAPSPSKRLKLSSLSTTDAEATTFGEDDVSALTATLQHYFGYNSFRGGQLSVLKAVMQEGRDCAVFWPTGFGKSLCFCIPPLHLKNSMAIIVSPLISLMQDQVHKLNGLVADRPLAAFLGSAQMDPVVEQQALQGYYPIVYVTPEKLASPGFLDQLAHLHQSPNTGTRICLIAVDEAHCVSEWGHDFRPEYRAVGQVLRGATKQFLADVPIMALTATATEQVQRDIVDSLRLRNPVTAVRSLDRPNLKLSVVKRRGGVTNTLTSLVQLLTNQHAPGTSSVAVGSTIVYAPTRALVQDICTFLQKNVDPSQIRVDSYHAGMTAAARQAAHTGFLTGTIQVIVATIAFGMGIDKPDIRRIVHYGPPKTVEEYQQQIGRAGRDGLTSECILYVTESDFDRYQSDFYLGDRNDPANTARRRATLESLSRFRAYCFDIETCRRKSLLEYFNQVPPFGDRCGTCDVCLAHKENTSNTRRDFGPLGARVVLTAVDCLQDQGLTNVLKVVGGSSVEVYRYKHGKNPSQVSQVINDMKASISRKFPSDYFRELVTQLVQKGFLQESTQSTNVAGFQRTWTVYRLSLAGQKALANPALPISLPVTEYVRRAEMQEEERCQRVLSELASKGLNKEKIPPEELQVGDGDVIRAYSKWYSYLESARRAGRDERLAQLEALLSAVDQWRSQAAVKSLTAPASVLSEHTLITIAYTTATLVPGMKLDKDSIVAAGVRSREVEGLVAVLAAWVDKAQLAKQNAATAGDIDETNKKESLMVLGETHAKNATKWQYAVYKPVKKTGVAVWEASYLRFAKGESPQTIAMVPEAGKKPIQVNTVVSHLLDAITMGRSVDLRRLADSVKPPTKREWEELRAAELSTGMDVCGDPEKSGKNGDRFTMSDFLRPVVGDIFVDTPFTERLEADKVVFSRWCDALKWYLALRRAGYIPDFSD